MFEELRFFLNQSTSPEHADYLFRAATTLEGVGLTSVGDHLEGFMATMNTRTTTESLSQLEDLLKTQTEVAINQFGVFLNEDDFSLKVATYILMGVHQIENYDNPLELHSICQSDADPEEKLTEILERVTPLTWFDFINTIESVSDSLIERIVDILPEVEENESVPKSETFILTRTKGYLEHHPNAWILDEVDNGLIIGRDPLYYIETFTGRYQEEMGENIDLDIISQELTGYLLLSNVPDSELITTQSELLEHVLTDPVQQGKLSLKIERLLESLLNIGT